MTDPKTEKSEKEPAGNEDEKPQVDNGGSAENGAGKEKPTGGSAAVQEEKPPAEGPDEENKSAQPVEASTSTADAPAPEVTATPTAPELANALPKEEPAKASPPGTAPTDRDVCIGDNGRKGTTLLKDLIRLHCLLHTVQKKREGNNEMPTKEEDVQDLATRLTQLMLNGKKFELSGLKDVPKPFLKGPGLFFVQKDQEWAKLDEKQATAHVTTAILEQFQELSQDTISSEIQGMVETLFVNTDPARKGADDPLQNSAPRPCDVLFLPVEYPLEESMPYEHQSGNKHLLFLASQNVAPDTDDTTKRVEAAINLVTSKIEVNSGTELVEKTPRYVAQLLEENQNSWKEMDRDELAEFAAIFVFEVYLEKQIHGIPPLNPNSSTAKPSTVPIEGSQTPYDVLFGRGGMTNGHQGNRRFRDVIALHRPDYIKATKMDKPNVARRIVRAIRQGNPPGRFLKKGEDDKWYDVGDRCAAEKTSQGLRERSNAEKRQRSALREALRIRRDDLPEGESGDPVAKKAKTSEGALGVSGFVAPYVSVTGQLNYAGAIPPQLDMKEKSKDSKKKLKKKDGEDEEENTETLPPNAVDKDGNILVTDYDILCGRGGLTNHHKGNKRFRDIVALHRPDYVRAPKIQKPSVARVIVRAIRNGDPPGRFLRKDDKTGKWVDIGDKKAAEKTSQALREKTNEEKDATNNPAIMSPTLVLPTPATDVAMKSETEVGKEKKADGNGGNRDTEKESVSNGGTATEPKEGEAMEVDGDEKKGDTKKEVLAVEV